MYRAHTTAVPFWFSPTEIVYEGESFTDALRAVDASLAAMPKGGQGGLVETDEPHIQFETFDRDPLKHEGVPTRRVGSLDVPIRVYLNPEN
jgi:hypothetical protein